MTRPEGRCFHLNAPTARTYHGNIDNDDVIFYHAGQFMSRRGVAPGSLTLHPQGIDHHVRSWMS